MWDGASGGVPHFNGTDGGGAPSAADKSVSAPFTLTRVIKLLFWSQPSLLTSKSVLDVSRRLIKAHIKEHHGGLLGRLFSPQPVKETEAGS